MIKRDLESCLRRFASKFPVVAVLGPRQAGKTTLTRKTFGRHAYVSLEDLDQRAFATEDPRGFLETYDRDSGVILDEIQHAPGLLSYIQTRVDAKKAHGRYILTGSQNFSIHAAITQTLAGRIAILTLLPFSIGELKAASLLPSLEQMLFQGQYPRLYDESLTPLEWIPNYIRTYIERDVRQIKNVGDLAMFQRFMKLCAGRIGQLLNVSSLASDCGISVNTVRSWLSLLEASYIIFLLQPHHRNFSKRLIKMPKLYFYDTGVACSLLGIEKAEELSTHYLRGGLFESLIISDLLKSRYHRGLMPSHYFWRDKAGHEIDCLIEHGKKLTPIEIKSGRTISTDYFSELLWWTNLAHVDPADAYVVYAGEGNQKRKQGHVIGWELIANID